VSGKEFFGGVLFLSYVLNSWTNTRYYAAYLKHRFFFYNPCFTIQRLESV